MTRSVCIINAHPDPSPDRLAHAICDAAESAARAAGHTTARIDVGALDFPYLTSAAEFAERPSEPISSERTKLARADHMILVFPLWLGSMPAKARGFFEQAARADFFVDVSAEDQSWPRKLMAGKSARVIVTMGMPSLVYRFGMDAGALKALERGLLGFSGFHPIHHTIVGNAGGLDEKAVEKLLEQAAGFGRDLT